MDNTSEAVGGVMLDLSLIADRSGIAVRKLRYVLDHGLLPGGKVASRGRGAARSFTPFEAFGIATAALMLEAGLKRATVRDCLAALCRDPGRKVDEIPFYRAFAADRTALLEVGDWRHVRLSGTGRSPRSTFDTGWLPLAGGAAAESYAPLVTVALDVGQIRRKVGDTG
jgi:hypothetical protein